MTTVRMNQLADARSQLEPGDAGSANSATARSLAILSMMSSGEDALSEAELAQQLELPFATVRRLVRLLEFLGYLHRVPGSKRYTTGHALNELAIRSLINSPRRDARHEALQTLADDIGQTCNVSCLRGDSIVLLDSVGGRHPLRKQFNPGATAPLHCTASGKLFLSMMPRQWRRQLLTCAPLKPFTERTLTDTQDIEKTLKLVRAHQIGLDDGEYRDEMIGIAVPVFDAKGHICATVSTNADGKHASVDKMRQLVPALKQASKAVSRTFAV
jgi:IclR family transcriptional regulator, acetate operon repressor